jgi:HEAT repeat protein
MSIDNDFSNTGETAVRETLQRFHSFETTDRDEAIMKLKNMDNRLTTPVLMKLIEDSDPNLRCDAAEALLVIHNKNNLGPVVRLLEDQIDFVRWNICGLLHDFGTSQVTPNLVHVLLNDPEPRVRGMAAWALGAIGDSTSIASLDHAAKNDDETDDEGRLVSDFAIKAIREIEQRDTGR